MKKLLLAGCAVAALTVLGGGGTPDFAHVRRGIDPEEQDRNVRFRTTYYFRVFDVCSGLQPDDSTLTGNGSITGTPFAPPKGQDARVLTDSLYRFRMTGKANGLASKVKFESGTLRKQEIDPFGATIRTDVNTGEPRFVSRKQNEARYARADAEQRLDKLMRLYGELEEKLGKDAPALAATRDTIQAQIQKVIAEMMIGPQSEDSPAPGTGEKSLARLADPAVALTAQLAKKQVQLSERLAQFEKLVTELPTGLTVGKKEEAEKAALKALSAVSEMRTILGGVRDSAAALAKRINREDETWFKDWQKVLDDADKTLAGAEGGVRQDLASLDSLKGRIKFTTNPLVDQTLAIGEGANLVTFTFLKEPNDTENEEIKPSANTDSSMALAETLAILVDRMRKNSKLIDRYEILLGEDKSSIWLITKKLRSSATFSLVTGGTTAGLGGKTAWDFSAVDTPDKVKLEAALVKLKAASGSAVGALDAAAKVTNQLKSKITSQLVAGVGDICPEGAQRRRGFQVLGPEGWRTFDQDERLIMAMSASAKPLISSLKQVSDQVLKQRATSSDKLLPLVREQLRISEARRLLDNTPEEVLDGKTVDQITGILKGEQ